jgi:hypothetical protein
MLCSFEGGRLSRLITAMLDDKAYQIWKTLDNKSKWLRQTLYREGLRLGTLLEHTGTPHVSWGLWENDARCNPHSSCPNCWSIQQLELIQDYKTKDGMIQALKEHHEGFE